jgi:hypothetical protein
LDHAAVAGGDQHRDARRRGQQAGFLRDDLRLAVALGTFGGSVADGDHVGEMVVGDGF